MAKEKRRDELAESLNNLLRSMSSMVKRKLRVNFKSSRTSSCALEKATELGVLCGHMAKEERQVELAESLNRATCSLLPRRPCRSSSLPVAVLSGRRPCRSPREPAGSCFLPRLSPLAPATFFLAGRRAAYLRSSSSPVAAAPLI
ncbi:hypothetical protein ACOSQ3_028878 [Xanthoceras sorbifolium]